MEKPRRDFLKKINLRLPRSVTARNVLGYGCKQYDRCDLTSCGGPKRAEGLFTCDHHKDKPRLFFDLHKSDRYDRLHQSYQGMQNPDSARHGN